MKKHHVSIVAIFRNEHQYIKEWLSYHMKVGVDHFYLFDNGGDHRELLRPFIDQITYTHWTDEVAQKHIGDSNFSRQTMAYTLCVEKFGSETEWLQLVDLDEYLVPLDADDVKISLKKHEDFGISKLRIPRFNFGNSGHWKNPAKGSIDWYTHRERKNSHHKDMGKPEAIKKVKGPHSFRVDGETVIPDNLRIHHHYTRSLSEWVARAKTGGGQAGQGFRVFLGKNMLLAYVTFFVLNLRSSFVISLLILLNIILAMVEGNDYLFLFNLPIIGLGIFSVVKGQNEVKDERLADLAPD